MAPQKLGIARGFIKLVEVDHKMGTCAHSDHNSNGGGSIKLDRRKKGVETGQNQLVPVYGVEQNK